MAFFDADMPVNNSKLDELELLVDKHVNVYKKKDLLYYEKDDTVLEVAGVLKEKNDGTIDGKIIAVAAFDADDNPNWDISNLNYDAAKLEDLIRKKSIEKVSEKLFQGKDTIWGSHLDDKLFGFDGDDTVKGWRGNDSLNGGKGNDELQGSYGEDTYVFDQDLKKGNVDTIAKFNVQDDSIELDRDIFTGLKKGTLHEDYFTVAKHAKGEDPQVIYREKKGHVLFDEDGDGKGDALKFANVGKHKEITHEDFFVT